MKSLKCPDCHYVAKGKSETTAQLVLDEHRTQEHPGLPPRATLEERA
ncbi:MAG: hypothetical protein Q8P05_02000 [Candidatus Diapherotrites archaeon]|nr:hypothetical protein [Candidatus Diapherotrites archaeon]MDZ4256615.1 hypothetical protein [archaeon]